MKGEISASRRQTEGLCLKPTFVLDSQVSEKAPQEGLPSWHPLVFTLWTESLTLSPLQIFNSVLGAYVKEKSMISRRWG